MKNLPLVEESPVKREFESPGVELKVTKRRK